MDIPQEVFHPKAIAVVGASENHLSFGYHYVRHLLDYGYPGSIYPVNPATEIIQGLKAYPSLSAVPEVVDYVICCVPASKVLDLLAECPARDVKVVHLVTARLSETGRQEAKDLEARILQQARKLNIRLIGPNCIGIYHPRRRVAHAYDLPKEAGPVGAVFQSGGGSELLVRYGELRGLRFSKVISYGNALDLDESDFLRYLARDAETEIIAAYFEGVKDGPKFLSALNDAASAKPVVAIKGGRGTAGTKAVASHTAAIAGSEIVWKTAFRKAGVVEARDISELVDFLVPFYFLPPITGNRVGIISSGGGTSVMSADVCEEAGLVVPPLPPEIKGELRARAPEIWDWVGNPIDGSIMSAAPMGFEGVMAEMQRMVARSPHFDFIIAEITDDNPFSKDVWHSLMRKRTEGIINLAREQLKPLVGVVSGGIVGPDRFQDCRWEVLAEQRSRLTDAGIPTYSTIAEAAKAMRQFISYWQTRAQT